MEMSGDGVARAPSPVVFRALAEDSGRYWLVEVTIRSGKRGASRDARGRAWSPGTGVGEDVDGDELGWGSTGALARRLPRPRGRLGEGDGWLR